MSDLNSQERRLVAALFAAFPLLLALVLAQLIFSPARAGISGGGAAGISLIGSDTLAGSGDFATASTTFVDVTGISVTGTAIANERWWVDLYAVIDNNTAGFNTFIQVASDTTRTQEWWHRAYTNGIGGRSFSAMTPALAAGSRTIDLDMRVDAGTGTLRDISLDNRTTLTVMGVR